MKFFFVPAALALAACATSGSAMPSSEDVANYGHAQLACDADAGTRAEADACRAQVKASYCSHYPGLAACQPGDGQ